MESKEILKRVKLNYQLFGKAREIYAYTGCLCVNQFDELLDCSCGIELFKLKRKANEYTIESDVKAAGTSYDISNPVAIFESEISEVDDISHMVSFTLMKVETSDDNRDMYTWRVNIDTVYKEQESFSKTVSTFMNTSTTVTVDSSNMYYSIIFVGTKSIPIVRLNTANSCDLEINSMSTDIYSSVNSKISIRLEETVVKKTQRNVIQKDFVDKAAEVTRYLSNLKFDDMVTDNGTYFEDGTGVIRENYDGGNILCYYKDNLYYDGNNGDKVNMSNIDDEAPYRKILSDIEDMLQIDVDIDYYTIGLNVIDNRVPVPCAYCTVLENNGFSRRRLTSKVDFYKDYVVITTTRKETDDVSSSKQTFTHTRLLDLEEGEVYNVIESVSTDDNGSTSKVEYQDRTGFMYVLNKFPDGTRRYSDPLLTHIWEEEGEFHSVSRSSLYSDDDTDLYYRDRTGMMIMIND